MASNLIASCHYSSKGLQPTSDGLYVYPLHFLALLLLVLLTMRHELTGIFTGV